jgi:hypothetical protein
VLTVEEVEVVVVAAALAVLVDVLLLEELEEPHPASRPATRTGASETNRRIRR